MTRLAIFVIIVAVKVTTTQQEDIIAKLNSSENGLYTHEENTTAAGSSVIGRNRTGSICPANTWEPYMKLSLVPLIAVIGIVGNILSFIVLCSPVYVRKSYSHYLRALAIFDTLTLILIAIRECDEICRTLGGYEMCIYPWLLRDTVSCKLWELFQHVVYLMSSWLVVCFTLDRYVAVCLPLQLPRLCTETRSKIVIAIMLLSATMTQLFRVWYVEHTDRWQPCHVPINFTEVNGYKVPTNESRLRRLTYMAVDTYLFSFCLRFLLPCLVIAFCNGSIIFHIVRMRRERHPRERIKARYANMAVTTLFVVCVFFVLSLLPNALLEIIMHRNFKLYYGYPKLYCVLLCLDGPFKMVRMLNYAFNFMLYGLTGRQFRREFFRILSGKSRLPFDRRLMFRFTVLDRKDCRT